MWFNNIYSGEHMLTVDQKELLRISSSKMKPEDFMALEKEEQEFREINQE